MKKIEIKNAYIYHIDFNGSKGSEINNIHLGIIYKIPALKNLVFVIPLTSPKEKHFKTKDDFIKRNYRELRYNNHFYIKQTDSLGCLDQIKIISTFRVVAPYKVNKKHVELNDNEKELVSKIVKLYIGKILKQ